MPTQGPQVEEIRIFVGSPADVATERRLAHQLIDQLNDSPHYRDRYRFRAVMWDKSSYPQIAWVSPQKAIEEHLPKPSECDVAVFIFWSRVGTPLPEEDYPEWPTAERLHAPAAEHRTGSVWEFYEAMAGAQDGDEGRPAVLLLRGTHTPAPDMDNVKEWAAQVQACEDFFDALNPDGYRVNVVGYDGAEGFEHTFGKQLNETLYQLTQDTHAPPGPQPATKLPPRVPEAYRQWILKDVEQLDNPGLDAKSGVAITLAQIYVPALTRTQSDEDRSPRDEPTLLLNELNDRSLYVPGQPGSGKTTFCRWVLGVAGGAIPLPSTQSEALPEAYREQPPSDLRQRLPILIRLRDFADTLDPTEREWGAQQFLDAIGEWLERKRADVGLTRALFTAHCEAGTVLLLLDGVDEVPTEGKTAQGRPTYPRSALLSGLASTLNSPTFANNRVLLTSRPYGLSSNDENQLALTTRDLSALPSELQNSFIDQWFRLARPTEWEHKAEKLRAQLGTRADLRELRHNPLMLHALCVKFHDGNQLPEDIHDLYDSIVSRVLHSRYTSDTKDMAAARRRLQVIAVDMHTGAYSGEPRVQPLPKIPYHEIERALKHFAERNTYEESGELNTHMALHELLRNSGLLFSRDHDAAEFAHLMFSYFLASERLRIDGVDLAQCMRDHGDLEAWHPTLEFRFAYEARDSLQRAMPVLDALAEDIEGDKLAAAPFKGALIGRCLEIADRRGNLGTWVERYQDIARRALALTVDIDARVQIYSSLGRMGLDDRPGVMDQNGVPDIDWVTVPAGTVVLEKHRTLPGSGEFEIERPFQISRYPITYRQFQLFVDDGGYGSAEWWTNLEQPSRPETASHEISNYPRDSVSHHEATAYCRWLSVKLGCTVDLPNEAQWQLAAAGPKGNKYPWGESWDPEAANTGRNAGAPVGLWTRDCAVAGVSDLAGGIGEWCDPIDEKSQTKPIRGGFWGMTSRDAELWARCAFRGWGHPLNRPFDIGFRVCRGSPSSS